MSVFPPRRARGRASGGVPAGGAARIRRFFGERRLLAWVVAAALVFFVAGYLLTWVLFFPGFGRSAIVTVPDLTDLPGPTAERTLGRLGLEVERAEALPNPRIRRGRVLMQEPLPGEEVPRGTPVRIVLSAGPELRTVPSVRGLRQEEAVGLLERYGFRVAIAEVADSREAGTLLGLRPGAGEPAAVGTVVELSVSAGPPFVRVPDVAGAAAADARARLEAVGLAMGGVSYAPGSDQPAGTVVGQAPAAGDSLRMGSAVRVTLAGADPTPPPPPPVEEEPWETDAADAEPAIPGDGESGR